MVQEVTHDKMARKRYYKREKGQGEYCKGRGAKDWKEDEVSMLIELLDERPRLWDIFNKYYPNLILRYSI